MFENTYIKLVRLASNANLIISIPPMIRFDENAKRIGFYFRFYLEGKNVCRYVVPQIPMCNIQVKTASLP